MDNNQVLNIIQWNSQSLRPKLVDFDNLLNREKIHIAIVSETWLEEFTPIYLRGYNVFRKDRFDSYGGVAIICHKSVSTQVCSIDAINPGIEAIQIRIFNCKYLENIVSIYCPSSVRTNQTDWDKIFSLTSKKTLLAGDFNGHHLSWSYKNDQRGIQLFDTALEYGFTSINSGEHTRVKLVNGNVQKSSPDISFLSTDISVHFNWKILNENLGSDHFIIKMSIKVSGTLNFINKRNFKQADWNTYSKDLTNSFFNLDSNSCHANNIQEYYDFFLDQINHSADKNIPLSKLCINPTNKFRPKEYWCPELSKVVAERRLALAKFRKNPTPVNLRILERKVAEARAKIKAAKYDSWRKFCSNIDECTSVAEMWDKMRWYKGYNRSKLIASESKRKELLYSLTPDTVANCPPKIASSNDALESSFTIQEMENILKKRDTSPGIDRITYSMIYHLPLCGKKFLLALFNAIFKLGTIPNQWRSTLIIPIPKTGVAMNSESNVKLRPISLISCICKIFHNMIGKRLEWFVEKHQILSPHTSGFRKAQSCQDCLTRLVTYIQIGFSNNTPTAACFLDIENAYNNVLVEKVIYTLDEIGAGKRLCKYLWSYLSERQLMIKNEKDEDIMQARHTIRGLAQGDPISPLLFNIVTYKICHQISNVIVSQYADDFVMYIGNKDLFKCEVEIQTALSVMSQLLDNIGLNISAVKSKICLFSRGFRRKELKININKHALKTERTVKYLGMWLDGSLRWNKHVNEIVEKISRFLNLLRILAGSGWGLHPNHLRSLYMSIIRSRLDYGCVLYGNSAKTNLGKLDRVQNQALRIIGGFIRSTPIHVMEAELSLPPLCLRRLYLAYKYCIKSMSVSENTNLKFLRELSAASSDNYWQRVKKPMLLIVLNDCINCIIHNSNPIEMFNLSIWVSSINTKDIIMSELECIKGNKREQESSIKFEVIKELNEKYNGWDKVFTDGSKSSLGSGAAYIDTARDIHSKYRINLTVSIMTVELIAILEALHYIKRQAFHNCVILTDSKSALQHLARCASGYSRGVQIAYEVLKVMLEVKKHSTHLKLQWIPAHIGLRGNEEADRLAKLACTTGDYFHILPFYTEILPKFKKKCAHKFKQYFDERSTEKGIWFKTIQCQPPRIPWFYNYKLSRREIVELHRLRSGHYPSNKFAYLMKKVTSPDCDVCGTIDDVQHILVECKKYEQKRDLMVRKFQLNRQDVGAFISILADPTSPAAKYLVEMILNH
jgi:ribonuclease HI